MGTPGTPWIIDKETIVKAIKNKSGRLTLAAKDLGVAYNTLKKRINADPELQELVADQRNEFEVALLDFAEDTLDYALRMRDTNIDASLKSAFYTLNNKGRSRGYEGQKKQDDSNDTVNGLTKLVAELNRSKCTPQSDMENKQPLFDQEQAGD